MKRIFCLLFALGSTLSTFTAQACAGGDDEWWNRPKYLFSSELLSDPIYLPYFNSWPYYGEENSDNYSALPQAMVEEWNKKLPQANPKDIQAALFSLNADVIEKLKNNQNPTPGNTFYQAILAAGTPYVEYLALVYQENSAYKEAENDWEAPTKDLEALKPVLEQAKTNLASCTDPFLKQKYVYMVVKLHHFLEQYSDAIESFDQYAESGEKNLSYYRALGYKAGATRLSGDSAQAKMIFARIFDQCPALRLMAYRNFKYIDIDVNKCLALAKTNTEKSAIWTLKYIYDDTRDFLALEELYKNDPGSARLELVLLKDMNIIHEEYLAQIRAPFVADTNKLVRDPKIEECGSAHLEVTVASSEKGWFARMWEAIVNFFKNLFGKKSEKETSSGKTEAKENIALKLPFYIEDEWLGEYVTLLEKINKEGKVKNKDLFKSALGYIYMVSGKFDEAHEIFAELSTSKNPTVMEVNAYLSLWNELMSHETISPEFEDHFTDFHTKYGNAAAPSPNTRIFDLQAELARRYLLEKQYNKAVLVHVVDYGESDILNAFFTCEMLDNLEAYLKSAPTSKLEKHFKAPKLEDIKYIKIQRFIQMGDFEQALKLSPEYDFSAYNSKINASVSLATLKQMVDWNQKGDAESYGKIADVIAKSDLWNYNSYPWGYWKGYSPRFCSYYSGNSPSAYYPFNVSGLAETYLNRGYMEAKRTNSVTLAESYYLKAIAKSTDDEFKASMYFKAQEAKNKSMYDSDLKQDYYSLLKDKYSGTRFYLDAYNSCAFLRLGKTVPFY